MTQIFMILSVLWMSPLVAKDASVIGSWTLHDFQLVDTHGESHAWCEGSTGVILYTPEGYMSVAINCGDRLDKQVFYAGTYEVLGKEIHHAVSQSSDPKRIGVKLVRQIGELSARRMTFVGQLEGADFTIDWRRD